MISSSKDGSETMVCSVAEFDGTNRKRTTIAGRDIFILKSRDKFYALDSRCFHAGGPLYKADIEEAGDSTCLVCPWHKYRVSVATGDHVYQVVKATDGRTDTEWKTAVRCQRTHKVTVHDGNVYVTLSDLDIQYDSDLHNKTTS